MSHEAVTWAMDEAPMLRTPAGKPDTTARHVLQTVAERADKDGNNAHPSVMGIQYRTGYDRTTVQRALRRLEAGGLIVREGSVGGRTCWRVSMHLRRPDTDWKELVAEEDTDRAEAAERKRRSRAKVVTHSESVTLGAVTDSTPVTVTGPESVTKADVTNSESVTHANVTDFKSVRHELEMRDTANVTDFKSVRHVLSAAQTVLEPSVELTVLEPSGSGSPPSSEIPRESGQTALDAELPESKPEAKPRRVAKPKTVRTAEQQAAFDAAHKIATWWWDVRCPTLGISVKSKGNRGAKSSFPGFRAFLAAFLTADPPCTPKEVQAALEACQASWPTDTRFEAAIRDLRGKSTTTETKPRFVAGTGARAAVSTPEEIENATIEEMFGRHA